MSKEREMRQSRSVTPDASLQSRPGLGVLRAAFSSQLGLAELGF